MVLLVRMTKQKQRGTEGEQSDRSEEQPDRAFWLFRYSRGGGLAKPDSDVHVGTTRCH